MAVMAYQNVIYKCNFYTFCRLLKNIYLYILWKIHKQWGRTKYSLTWNWWRLIIQLIQFFCHVFSKRMPVTDCWWQAGEFTTHSLTYFSVQIIHAYSCEHFTFMCNSTISFLSELLQPSHRANRKLRNDKWHPDVILWLLLGLMKGKKSHRHASPVFPAVSTSECHQKLPWGATLNTS